MSKRERKLQPMTETLYVTEDDLQAFQASYPDLIPGEQISPDNPRGWLLVVREMGVPGETAGGVISRWDRCHYS